ncbi:MAG: 50S ribosomal protein L17 [Candidatus Marinimicrobia bacterium]|jgi:large subunit ribosomal protein L17|uniref:50S ribosomal protein L17 n=1 Tax=marine metagenome TaxID=408172 RepID=A0A381PF82_9ZZZZ|nr:50S ribosomal protein L17 [Candidatus Neomarinimicrobiota bacterium]MDP6167729.1 50S ribosomal protein L17 [Candidatus Neomarinimicrobiota bacterium]MDP6401516.1 50S ribosomal protein L17 [Candidatus Neomarinimicrobiota bacterium]MDP6613464.1 50S ribosomal protein L17 [Candidatus Neomarinimicrobiota bacterium]MDP6820909.1 50S ribosomal protein L17 [Candidatus Neomarinimicrobiota bacterium]|tara:strand:+ start:1942 stop:2334 length:393 start_codon:yes stop_codon:yes gene_type:complete
MRHNKSGRKLGRKTASRKALMSNLASALITHKRIKTTDAKAKELRMYVEPLVTFAKRGDLHARRQVLKKIPRKAIIHELFDTIGPSFSDRDGGYTRITKLGFRDNDRAPMSLIEFVGMTAESVPQGESTE